jgi:hypothetical protein
MRLKRQLTADAVEVHKPERVDDQHVDAEQPLLEPGELSGIARFDQLRTRSAFSLADSRKMLL